MSRSPCLNGRGQPKFAYESMEDAEAEAVRVNGRLDGGRSRVAVYKCPVCRALHVGKAASLAALSESGKGET